MPPPRQRLEASPARLPSRTVATSHCGPAGLRLPQSAATICHSFQQASDDDPRPTKISRPAASARSARAMSAATRSWPSPPSSIRSRCTSTRRLRARACCAACPARAGTCARSMMRMMADGFITARRLARLARRRRGALACRRCGPATISRSTSTCSRCATSQSRPELGIVHVQMHRAQRQGRCALRDDLADPDQAGARAERSDAASSRRSRSASAARSARYTFTAEADQDISPRSSIRSAFTSTRRRAGTRCSAGSPPSGWHVGSACMQAARRRRPAAGARGDRARRGGCGVGTVAGLPRPALDPAGARRRHRQLTSTSSSTSAPPARVPAGAF